MRIELREVANDACRTGCAKEERLELTDKDICRQVRSASDGLDVRCVGSWAYDKIYFLKRYFEEFSIGMSRKWQGNIAYFEIASGPGRCILRNNGTEIDGTALTIIRSTGFDRIKKALFMDINKEIVDILNLRIRALDSSGKAHALVADYKDGATLASIIRAENPRGLNLVFMDPTDCSVPFDTIRELKLSGLKFDLIINVATFSDFNRNIKQAIEFPESNVRMKYESFLGNSKYFSDRSILEALQRNDNQTVRIAFMEAYYKQLNSIGLTFTDAVDIHHLYYLVYASADSRGKDFWDKAVKSISPHSQREFSF